MSEHAVYVNPRWLEAPHDCQSTAGCVTCGWRQDTVTPEYALLLAVKHKREAEGRVRAARS